jgi:hypothetical protein
VNLIVYFDAILRFPRVPSFDSFFALKLVFGVVAKTIAYSMGFIDVQRWTLTFLAVLFLNVWLIPVMYVLVIPYGDSSPFRKDKDILVSLYHFIVDKRARTSAIHTFLTCFRFSPPNASRAILASKDITWI